MTSDWSYFVVKEKQKEITVVNINFIKIPDNSSVNNLFKYQDYLKDSQDIQRFSNTCFTSLCTSL